jgi:hypothetical protein
MDKECIKRILSEKGAYAILSKNGWLPLVIELTNFLPEHVTMSQRFWHIRNDVYNMVKCPQCGINHAKFHDSHGYTCCSKECTKLKTSKSIKNSSGKSLNKSKQTCLEKYGVDNVSKLNTTKSKSKQTCLEKYGVDNVSKTDGVKSKKVKTCIIRYNVDNVSKTDGVKSKKVKTCLEKYGVNNVSKTDEVKSKKVHSFIKKYGVDHPFKSGMIKNFIKDACLEKYGVPFITQSKEHINRRQISNLEKYGNKQYFLTDDFMNKSKNTCLEKYGVENYSKSMEFKKNYQEKLQEKLGDEYNVLDLEYPNYIINHKLCGNTFSINNSTLNDRVLYNNHILCTVCNPISKSFSMGEKELLNFIYENYNGEIIENDVKTIKPYELDIYLPDLKLAIEYNGLYWHSEDKVGKNYHKYKSQMCANVGIKLIHVWENHWMDNKDIVKSILSGYLNKHKRYFARKCVITEMSANQCRRFMDRCHLQGFVGATVYYGMYSEGDLLQIMSFKKIGDKWEISRLCSDLNTTVIGGAQKLYKRFIRDVNPREVFSYNNNDYFTGGIYEKLGLEYLSTSEPGYSYFNSTLNQLSRQKCQKHKLVNEGFDPNKTEVQIMNDRGYFRVFNTGNNKYGIVYD